MKKITFALITSILLGDILYANNNPEMIFDKKCGICHTKVMPKNTDKIVAPNINGVMKHIKMKYKTKEEAVKFISEYIYNPNKNKAICKAKKIKKFGLMPSLKGTITKTEIDQVSKWLFDNYPSKDFVGHGMMKKTKNMKKKKKFKPFLITSGIPHLTGIILNSWDDEDLNLTDEQKKKLKKIRIKTLMSLKDLKLEVKELEDFIKESIRDGESKKEIFSMVDELGALKIKATKIHIECVEDTKNVLTQEQLKYIMEQI